MGIFTYLFCREIKLNKFSALATAIISTFGSTFAIIIFPGHIDMSDSIIWFPALLLSFELSIQKRKLSYGITSGIILALMLLTGFIQTVTYGLTAALIYFLLRLISEYRKNIWILIKLCMIPILTLSVGFLLSAIQLLPNMEFSKLSIRHLGLSYQFASDFSLRPYQLISVLFPHFFGSPLDNTWWAHGNLYGDFICIFCSTCRNLE
jgi:asparagine N-glycosylation enzyme membrane subunit Stt3